MKIISWNNCTGEENGGGGRYKVDTRERFERGL